MTTPRPALPRHAGHALALPGNVLGYQAVWLLAVAGAGAGLAWPGPLAALVFVALTLRFGGHARADLRTLALAVPLGIVLDSAFAASGLMVYAPAWPLPWLAPPWIWALWAAFAMTLNHSLAFLRGRPALGALLGAVGGPLAYWAAAGPFDAVAFGTAPARVLGALAIAWGVALPLLLHVDGRLAAHALASRAGRA